MQPKISMQEIALPKEKLHFSGKSGHHFLFLWTA
jgi:hypothetical protein